jgi:hypothetical protein
MARLPVIACCLLGGLFAAMSARADDEGRPLRLIGEAVGVKEPGPARFFIQAVVTKDDEPFKSRVEGWLAVLPPGEGSAEITGTCVENACALSASLDDGALALSGDLIAATPGPGKFQYDSDDQKGVARFTPFTGAAIPGVGELAPDNAVDAAELTDILSWNGAAGGFDYTDKEGPPTDTEREALARWQGANERAPTGLILAADLTALRNGAREAKAKAGWTAIGDKTAGWSSGYPAALLPVATRSGAEQRFASADGKALLVIAIEPPRSDEDFDAFVDAETGDHKDRQDVGYTRVNSDMEVSYTTAGVRHVTAYHTRKDGFARLAFTYPAESETYQPLDTLVARSLRVTRELKAQ